MSVRTSKIISISLVPGNRKSISKKIFLECPFIPEMNPYLHSFRLGNNISIMMSVIIKNENKRVNLGFVEEIDCLEVKKAGLGRKKEVCVLVNA